MKSLHLTLYSLHTMLIASLLTLITSCHSHKEVTTTAAEVVDIEAAGSVTTSTAERYQWLSRLSLDIDSFEVVIPTNHFAEVGKMDSVTANGHQSENHYSLPVTPYTASNARLIVRGKHASIGKADIVQRNSASIAEQVDTLSAHRSIDKSDHYARDNVGIAKPPDLGKLPWLIAGALAAICIFLYHRKR